MRAGGVAYSEVGEGRYAPVSCVNTYFLGWIAGDNCVRRNILVYHGITPDHRMLTNAYIAHYNSTSVNINIAANDRILFLLSFFSVFGSYSDVLPNFALHSYFCVTRNDNAHRVREGGAVLQQTSSVWYIARYDKLKSIQALCKTS